MHDFDRVEKKDSITYEAFIQDYVEKGIPVVLKNASSVWSSNTKFTPQFFSEKFGDEKTSLGDRQYSMNEILDITAKSTPEHPSPYPILFEVSEQLPELLEMFYPIHMNYSKPNWFNSKVFPYGKFGKNIHLFIGGKGNQYSLHKDFYHTNAWITQLYGEKKFIVFPGGQDEYLYAGTESFSKYLSPVNVVNPDLDKYPKYKHATPLEVVLQPGETIFIPNGVWHTTVALGQNISLIFDQLNGRNYQAWKKDMYHLKKDESKIKAAINYVFATSAGSVCRIKSLFGSKF